MEAYKPPAPAPQAAPDADAVPDDSPAAEFDLARRSAARPQMPTFPSLLYVAQVRALQKCCSASQSGLLKVLEVHHLQVIQYRVLPSACSMQGKNQHCIFTRLIQLM